MKKYSKILAVALCMGFTSSCVFAQEIDIVPIKTQIEKTEDIVSIHQINMDVPITRAEFIFAIISATGVELPPIMDTHYAMPAMEKAEQLGIIDLEAYPIKTWSEMMPNEEKVAVLTKAMQNNDIDMGKVYTGLNQILIEHIEIEGKLIDLQGLPVRHYKGKLMLPMRGIAEAMGFEVTWNPTNYTATLNNGDIESMIQIGFDSYNYSSVKAIGMSAPFSAGAAPLMIDGTFYVPVDYFSMFANSEVVDHTVRFIMK